MEEKGGRGLDETSDGHSFSAAFVVTTLAIWSVGAEVNNKQMTTSRLSRPSRGKEKDGPSAWGRKEEPRRKAAFEE